jgi:hypothetical protein
MCDAMLLLARVSWRCHSAMIYLCCDDKLRITFERAGDGYAVVTSIAFGYTLHCCCSVLLTQSICDDTMDAVM